MKNRIRYFLGFGLLALIAFYGCKSDPNPDIKKAQRAKENAEAFHSEELAAPEWKEALQAWEKAQAELKKNGSPIPDLRKAKTLFDKAAKVADANGNAMEPEIAHIQKEINQSYLKVKEALENGRIAPKVKKEVEPLLSEVQDGSATVRDLVMHCDWNRAKARVLDTQEKMLNAERMLAGKKPSR
jgi:hypothetical protein